MFADRLVRLLLDDLDSEVASAAAQTDRNPTKDEKESGDYEKGEVTVHGLDIEIENAKGSTRSGEHDGKAWCVKMPAVYGYFVRVDGQKAPKGKDKDEIDVYIGPDAETETVFVVNQKAEKGGFDEHKCMIGFATKEEAVKVYDNAFSCDLGPKLRDSIATLSMADFKEWLKTGDKKKPISLELEEAQERIIGVAVKFPSGMVYTDITHHDATNLGLQSEPYHGFTDLIELGDSSPEAYDQLMASLEDGFETSTGRFVGREEAFRIASQAGQNPSEEYGKGILHSLDYTSEATQVVKALLNDYD